MAKNILEGKCCSCGAEIQKEIDRSINVGLKPELKDKVFSGEIFVSECPSCGTKNLMVFDCLYHDPKEMFMVWLVPSRQLDMNQIQAINYQAKSMGEYKLRLVTGFRDFIEKTMILDAGLNDRCIELVKYVEAKEMGAEMGQLFYCGIQDSSLMFYAIKDGKMTSFGIGMNVYEDCMGILMRNEGMLEEEGFARIDAEWVEEFMA